MIGLLAGAIAGGPAAAQDIYRWVDEDGVVHFSDCLLYTSDAADE